MSDIPTFILALLGALSGVSSILWAIIRSKQEDQQREAQIGLQQEQEEKQRQIQQQQIDIMERQAIAWESTNSGNEEADTSGAKDRDIYERWTRAYVSQRIASLRTSFRRICDEAYSEKVQKAEGDLLKTMEQRLGDHLKEIRELEITVTQLTTKIEDKVSSTEFMTREGVFFRLVSDGERIQKTIQEQMDSFHRQGVTREEIQKYILYTLGTELLSLSEQISTVSDNNNRGDLLLGDG